MLPKMLRAIVAVPDAETRNALLRVLEAQGFEVTTALSRVAALVGLVLKRPDILVMNADFPGADFGEFLRLACACHPETRLLLISGEKEWEEMIAVKHWLSEPLSWGTIAQATLKCMDDAAATVAHLRIPFAFPTTPLAAAS